MRWAAVARTDLRHAVRSRLLQGTAVIFVLAVVLLAIGLSVAGERVTASGAITYVISLLEWLVPIVGLVVGYGAVVSERDDRTIQHLLTAPHSRRAIVVGKLLSRSIVVAVPIGVGLSVAAIVVAVLFPGMGEHAVAYVLFVVLTILFGGSLVGLSVGISAASRRPVRAATSAMGAFIGFVFLWDLVPAGIYYVGRGSLPGSRTPPDWYFLVLRINPIEAYVALVAGVFPFLDSELIGIEAWFLSGWVMLLVLGSWILVPVMAGYLSFRRADMQ